MQFEYNSNHPAVDPVTGTTRRQQAAAAPPPEFPAVQPIPCARINTRVYYPQRNAVATVQNVLVKTMIRNHNNANNNNMMTGGGGGRSGDVSWSTDSSDDDMSSSNSVDNNNSNSNTTATTTTTTAMQQQSQAQQQQSQSATSAPAIMIQPTTAFTDPDRAYWIQRTVREAIYGRVWMAVVLQRRRPAATDGCEWLVTPQYCAVKEMSWQHIRRERHRLAEDPIKEVAAMQYIKAWHYAHKQQQQSSGTADTVDAAFASLRETNIMMPLDLLTDDRHLYSIMPYAQGGELFERLDLNERFSEPEARYWMYQVLNVSCVL